jgi:hypothetical protein
MVDAPVNFWYWLACLLPLLAWKRADARWFWLGAVAAGLAVGTKIDRLVVLFPLAVSFALSRRVLTARHLGVALTIVAAAYVVANPTLLLSPFEFLDGTSRDLFYNMLRDETVQTSYPAMLEATRSGLGLPLFLLVATGVVLGVFDAVRGRDRQALLWLFATSLPYMVVFGGRFVASWYVVFFFPFLALLGARAVYRLSDSLPARLRVWPAVAVAGVLAATFVYAADLAAQFTRDPRYRAGEWMVQHIPPGASVELLRERGPTVSEEMFRVVYVSADRGQSAFARRWRATLESDRRYNAIRDSLYRIEHWAGRALGVPLRKGPYRSWFDPRSTDQPAEAAAEAPARDYVVVTDTWQKERLASLQSPGSGYRLEAQILPDSLFGEARRFHPSLGPNVYIFRRERGLP